MLLCTYCGEPAESLDHVVPVSFTHANRPKGKQGEFNNGFERVPACRDCNGTLRNLMINSVEALAAYLAGRLESRFRKVLKMPRWDEDDLEELGHALRSSVEATVREQERVRRRIAHCRKVAGENLSEAA